MVPTDVGGADEPSAFSANVVSQDGEAVVHVSGEIDLSVADRLWTCVQQAAASSSDRVVFDLSEVDFIDSAGVKVLMQVYRDMGQVREAVVVRSPSPTVLRVLALSGIGDYITVEVPGEDGWTAADVPPL